MLQIAVVWVVVVGGAAAAAAAAVGGGGGGGRGGGGSGKHTSAGEQTEFSDQPSLRPLGPGERSPHHCPS